MPRSRSKSIESSTCASISRSDKPPHIWMKRSERVDLPWSIWAMMEKLRMRSSMDCQGAGGKGRHYSRFPVHSIQYPFVFAIYACIARVMRAKSAAGTESRPKRKT